MAKASPQVSTEVATYESPQQAPAPAVQGFGPPQGMESMSAADLVIPRLRIVQSTSEEGSPGTFRLNLTGDEFKELNVVFLKVTKGRVMFSKDLTAGAVCGSADRITPAPYFENPMSDHCQGCHYAQWQGKTPPECNESYTLLGLDIESGIPFFFQTRVTALKPTQLFLSGIAFKARKLNAALCDFQTTLRLKEVKNDKGKYFVPIFEKITHLPDRPFRDDAALYAHEEATWETEKTPDKTQVPDEAMGF